VGLLDGRRPLLGCVLAPYLDLEFATAGDGVTVNGDPVAGLGRRDPAAAVVATGFPFRRKERRERYLPVFEGGLARFEDLRRAGAASLDLAWTAAGNLDGFFELGLGTWDVAAGAALVLAAGGVVTDWEGGDAYTVTGDIIAGPAGVHEVLLALARS
jgi:myo-inositol-1(or 4)-monophosphatase